MSFMRFHPGIDGLTTFHTWQTNASNATLDQQNKDAIISNSLAYLKHNYQGAIKAYDINSWLTSWHQISDYDGSYHQTGLLVVVLDYFYARCSLPKKFKDTGSKSAKRFQTYFDKRAAEGLVLKATEQLITIAILKLMPDSWIGESVIKSKIKREIKSIGQYVKPEIKFDLNVPKSGKPWLQDKYHEAWKKLKEQLDHNKPQLITYIIETANYEHVSKTVIAYDYRMERKKNAKIFIYDLDISHKIKSINLHLDDHRAEIGEINGIYIEKYKPARIPVITWFGVLRLRLPGRIYWYLKRILFLWFKA